MRAPNRSGSSSKVGPIRESVLVTATRTEAPASQVGASATVFTAEDLERRQVPLVADLVGDDARRDDDPQRRPGHADIAVRARRRERLQQGAPRRHSAERAGRQLLPEQPDDREPRSHRDRPRRVLVAVRIRRDGQRHPALHPARRRHRAAPARIGADRRRHLRHGPRERQRGGRDLPRRLLRRRRRSSAATTACRTAASRTRRSAETSASAWIRRPRCALSAAPSSRTSARRARRPSAGPISTPSSTETTSSFSVAFDQSPDGPFTQRAFYSTAVSEQTSTNLVLDPAVHGDVRGATRHSPVERLPRTTRTPICAGIMRATRPISQLAASPSYGDHRLTLMADWDGERATQENRLARHDHRELPRQLRRRGAAPDALAAGVCDRRRSHRAQRELRHRPGAAGDGRLRRADRRRARSAKPGSRRAPAPGSRNRR